MFAAGFYYKTFKSPRFGWKHLFEPLIRRAAGFGEPAHDSDPDTYEHFFAHTDVLVVGGGLAGLIAAGSAADSGARVLLLDRAVVSADGWRSTTPRSTDRMRTNGTRKTVTSLKTNAR